MIGWCPSFRVGVAVRPTTYLAFTCRITCSNVKAEMWWHSSTITWPYSATKSFTSPQAVHLADHGRIAIQVEAAFDIEDGGDFTAPVNAFDVRCVAGDLDAQIGRAHV